MKELKMVLETAKNFDDYQVYIYKIGRYSVRKTVHKGGFTQLEVLHSKSEYLPMIYCKDDLEGNVLGFEIQTTSYGSLPIEEIKKMIANMEEAIATAEILTKEFVKNLI